MMTTILPPLLVLLGSIGMFVFARRFPFTTALWELKHAKERFFRLNGYDLWNLSWIFIIVGSLIQLLGAIFAGRTIMYTAIYEWMKGLDSGITLALVSILALWYKLHSTQRQIRLQNFIEYTKRYQEIILNFPENINENSFVFADMSPWKKNKTMRYMRAYFDLCCEEFTLHEKKFIDNFFKVNPRLCRGTTTV